MKTINSKKNKMLVFANTSGDITGFAGYIKVYDKSIYVDTRDGTGYNDIIENLGKFVNHLSTKYHFDGFSFEDIKQHILVYILESIPKYDPRRNTKLSTFIQTCVNRKMINELRDRSRMSRNATTLNLHYYSIWCSKCKNNFDIAVETKDDIDEHVCIVCGNKMDSDCAMPYNKQEISLEYILSYKYDSDSFMEVANNQKVVGENMSSLYNLQKSADEEIIEKYDLESLLNDLNEKDPCVAKLIELHCFKGYSIKDAAKEVGLSGMGASLKLKNLKRKLKVKEIFGR